MSNQNKNIVLPLSRQTVIEAAQALHRLSAPQSKLFTKENENQKSTDEAFLNTVLRQHASEFFGAWFAANDEYQPLVNGLAAVLRRSAGINGAIAAQFQQEKENETKV
jgi:hypothetical protein